MSIALWPSDKELYAQLKDECAFPSPVWGRLWFLFCAFGNFEIVSEKQFKHCCMPDIQVDELQHVSASQVQNIVHRIEAAVADGSFENKIQEWGVWKDGTGSLGLGEAAKSWWPHFLEFVRTLGTQGFAIQG